MIVCRGTGAWGGKKVVHFALKKNGSLYKLLLKQFAVCSAGPGGHDGGGETKRDQLGGKGGGAPRWPLEGKGEGGGMMESGRSSTGSHGKKKGLLSLTTNGPSEIKEKGIENIQKEPSGTRGRGKESVRGGALKVFAGGWAFLFRQGGGWD